MRKLYVQLMEKHLLLRIPLYVFAIFLVAICWVLWLPFIVCLNGMAFVGALFDFLEPCEDAEWNFLAMKKNIVETIADNY